jgi:ligand-binding SRPBCC domain-containing protein
VLRFVKETVIPASVEAVFAFHERPDAFELLLPPWDRSEVIQPPLSLEVGTKVIVRTKVGPIWTTIEAEHVEYEKNRVFADVMRKGPFAKWHHWHRFFEHPQGCRLVDEIEYEPPLGWLGRLAAPVAIRPRLRKMFDYRHEVTRREVLARESSAA